MDRAIVGLVLAAIALAVVAGSYALYALLDLAIRAITHHRRNR